MGDSLAHVFDGRWCSPRVSFFSCGPLSARFLDCASLEGVMQETKNRRHHCLQACLEITLLPQPIAQYTPDAWVPHPYGRSPIKGGANGWSFFSPSFLSALFALPTVVSS